MGMMTLLLDVRNTPAGTIGINPTTGSGGGPAPSTTSVLMPYYIPSNSSFTVPTFAQGLYSIFIDAQGALILDGVLVEVD